MKQEMIGLENNVMNEEARYAPDGAGCFMKAANDVVAGCLG